MEYAASSDILIGQDDITSDGTAPTTVGQGLRLYGNHLGPVQYLTGATVRFTQDSYHAGDLLSAPAFAGIASNFDTSTGVLTLSGVGTVITYQTLLQLVQFTSSDPHGERVLEFRAGSGTPATVQLTLTHANEPPQIDAPVQVDYLAGEAGQPLAVASGISVSDADNLSLTGATVVISGGHLAEEDLLTFTPVAGISGSFDAASGTLSFSGQASLDDYRELLASVSYTNLKGLQGTGQPRVLSFQVDDGWPGGVSNLATTELRVFVPPVASGTQGLTTYVENAPGAVVDAGLTLASAQEIVGAQVSIALGLQEGDVLGFDAQAGITGQYANGLLQLSGAASAADYQAVLRSIRFASSNDDPQASKLVSWTVTSASGSSAQVLHEIQVVPVNDPPRITAATQVHSDGIAPVQVAPSALVQDPDSADFAGGSLRVGIAQGATQGDELAIAPQALLSVSGNVIAYDGLEIGSVDALLDGTGGKDLLVHFEFAAATVEAVQALVRSLVVSSTAWPGGLSSRTVGITLVDGDGGSDTGAASVEVQVRSAPGDQPPLVVTSPGDATYVEHQGPTLVDIGIAVSDTDDLNLQGARVWIEQGAQQGDTLTYSPVAGISGSYDPASHALTFTGIATLESYRELLASIAFSSTHGSGLVDKVVAWTVDDGQAESAVAHRTISVGLVNEPPVIDLAGAALVYVENASPASIAPAAVLTDVDAGEFVNGSLTVAWTQGAGTQDQLAIRNEGDGTAQIGVSGNVVSWGGVEIGHWSGGSQGSPLQVSFDSPAATAAAVQALLRNIAYWNSSDAPSALPRDVSYVFGNGFGDDHVIEAAASGDEDDIAQLAIDGLDPQHVWFSRVNDQDLLVQVFANGVRQGGITVDGWFASDDHKIEQFQIGNQWATASRINSFVNATSGLVQSMATNSQIENQWGKPLPQSSSGSLTSNATVKDMINYVWNI